MRPPRPGVGQRVHSGPRVCRELFSRDRIRSPALHEDDWPFLREVQPLPTGPADPDEPWWAPFRDTGPNVHRWQPAGEPRDYPGFHRYGAHHDRPASMFRKIVLCFAFARRAHLDAAMTAALARNRGSSPGPDATKPTASPPHASAIRRARRSTSSCAAGDVRASRSAVGFHLNRTCAVTAHPSQRRICTTTPAAGFPHGPLV